MAKAVLLENPESGIIKTGYYGFSWTTFFFGFFPALFRSDFKTFICGFIVLVILAFLTMGIGSCIGMFIWAFMYNKYYTTGLLKKGYKFVGDTPDNQIAAGKLGVRLSSSNTLTPYQS